MGNKLPKNWEIVPLEAVGENKYYAIGDGDHGKIKPSMYQDNGIPYIRVSDIDWGYFKKEKLVYISEEVHNINLKSELVPGDVLIAKTGATIGKCCIVPKYIEKANTTSSVGKVSINKALTSSKWVLYYFLSSEFFKLMWSHSNRTAQPGFNNIDLKKFPLPLPPIAEQERIIAKLDALFAQHEAMKKALERIPQLLKDFRQQVLTQALTGRLTEEWREGEKLNAYSFEELDKFREEVKSVQANKITRSKLIYKKSSEVKLGENTKGIESLYNIPKSWLWVNLDQVTWNISDGPHFSPKYVLENEGKKFISMRNVGVNGIDFSDCKYVSIDDHNQFIKRGKPEVGDLVYTKGGSTGIACVLDTDVDFSYWVHLALLKVVKKAANPTFLRNALNSPMCYKQSQAFTHGVGNQDLGLTRMIYITFPLPPLTEQNEIVSRVGSLFAKADKIEEKYKVLKARLATLPQAILHKAFKGGLVAQLPTDGDARGLLQQIKKLKIK